MKKLTLGLLLLLSQTVWAQDGGDNDDEFSAQNVPSLDQLVTIPPSPEAQAFTKNGNIQNSLYTGVPEISIPIHNIQGRTMAVPINLTYDASGLVVDKIATWVGLDWNLNVGGVVTRKVHGLPDDYFNANPPYVPFYASSQFEKVRDGNFLPGSEHPAGDLEDFFTYRNRHIQGKEETQPDAYSFNINGLSGTIYIDYTTSPVTGFCLEHPDIKVVPIISNADPIKIIEGWSITDNTGNEYLFLHPEKTQAYDGNASEGYRTYYSSWFITQIKATNDRDVIDFNYSTPVLWQQPQLAGRGTIRRDRHTNGYCGPKEMIINGGSPEYQIEQFDLTTIDVNGTKRAEFFSSALDRSDLRGKKSLEEIHFFNSQGDLLNQFEFVHSYFGTIDPFNDKASRLKLDALYEYGNDKTQKPKKYDFIYNPGAVPSRNSYAVDFWGFYNGANDNTTLIPYSEEYDPSRPFNGADREPSLEYARVGVLQKIVYPTGGYTEFDYILHNDNSHKTVSQTTTLGGLSLSGGTDVTNPFNYCDDMSPLKPIGNEDKFEITEEGNYDVTFTVSDGGNVIGNHLHFAAIYPTGSGECIDTILGPLCSEDIKKDFCELWNNSENVFDAYNDYSNGTEITETVFLPAGHYRILLLNSNSGTTADLLIRRTADVQIPTLVGGLRTFKIVDKTENNKTALQKYYYYNDASQVENPDILTEDFLKSSYNTSAKLHAKKEFFSVYTSEHVGNGTDKPAYYTCNSFTRYSSNRSLQSGPHITYGTVTEIIHSDDGPDLFTTSEFRNDNQSALGIPFQNNQPLNGRVERKAVYKTGADELILVQEEIIKDTAVFLGSTVGYFFESQRQADKFIVLYEGTNGQEYYGYQNGYFSVTYGTTIHCDNVSDNSILCIPGPSGMYQKRSYTIKRYWIKSESKTIHIYDGAVPLTDETLFYYDNPDHYQLTRTEKFNSDGVKHGSKIYYAHDLNNPLLLGSHRVAEPLKTEILRDDQVISEQVITYRLEGGVINAKVIPDLMSYSVNGNTPEPRISYHKYDEFLNPTEVSRINETPSVYLWGYNYTLPVAKIDNATYDEVLAQLGISIEQLQALPNESIKSTLQVLRENMPESIVTSYTYKPQVGIKTITDAAGQSISYEYDWLNRLKTIRDNDGKILETYTYNYINE